MSHLLLPVPKLTHFKSSLVELAATVYEFFYSPKSADITKQSDEIAQFMPLAGEKSMIRPKRLLALPKKPHIDNYQGYLCLFAFSFAVAFYGSSSRSQLVGLVTQDEKPSEKIKNAELQLHKKIRCRNAIGAEILDKRVDAKKLLRSKLPEIQSIQHLMKNVTSIEEIDTRIIKEERLIELLNQRRYQKREINEPLKVQLEKAAVAQGIKIGKILIHRVCDNGQQVQNI
ncbi:hypothetical protein L2E82_41221 [Cichorium intybus]|uniref:Uncharacterized protein n=1 Tax=Cichorium intybus TaxID=13427 RepID=A0ACB9AMI2_CICIN|nr:hypothetical protein L2E82_41221 [Cichorium intybus]